MADVQTERCAHCGTASTDGGRYCINCGAELGTEPTNPRVLPSATDTAERVYDVPAPVYATTAGPPAATPGAYPSTTEPVPLVAAPGRHARPGPGLWLGVVAVMVLALVLGGYLLLHGGGGDGGSSAKTPIVPTTHATSAPTTPSSSTAGSPASASSSSSSSRITGPPTNVAGFARVSAPDHAPTGVDFAGDRVTYVAANLVDGRNDTCWRTPGDATGTEITFRLDQPTRLTRVGLVNGYAKIAYAHGRAYDWYLGNRRVLAVDWVFDDGTSVPETFGTARTMQQIAIHPVTTRTVTLRITKISPPGKGRAGRNDTAISEVLLLGRTG